jgi:hypothetical protein
MLAKIVILWYGNDQWQVSFRRERKVSYFSYYSFITYAISIERAEKIRDIMYKTHVLGLCDAPFMMIKYHGKVQLSVSIW